jgi:hypothetical protein
MTAGQCTLHNLLQLLAARIIWYLDAWVGSVKKEPSARADNRR